MDLQEQQVIAALQEGDETAYEVLFKNYYPRLCHYAFTFLNDKDEAEEVVQSAFMGIWEKRKSLAIQTSVNAYLYRMVRNACLNMIKHTRIKQIHAHHELSKGEPRHDHVTQSLIATELEQKIYEAINLLPEQCRIVFQLSRFEELKYSEIAVQLEISVKTVENQMGKALKVLRGQLKDYLPIFIIFIKDWID